MTNISCVLHHHIGPESPFETGLNIASSSEAYAAQMDWMVQHYNVVSLDQVLTGDVPKRALLLTFDDAFRSVLDVVREILVPRGLPSVFFINPGLLEAGAISLDSTLAWAAGTAGLQAVCTTLDLPLRENIGTVVVQDMASRSAQERKDIRDRLLAEFGPPDLEHRAALITSADIRELVSMDVEIGNHTMNHVHCRSLLPNELELEIGAAKARLEELSGQRVRSFSVPYGHEDDLTPEVLDYVRATGHEAIFLVHARANWRRPTCDIWYRTSLHNERPGNLNAELRAKPFMRSIKQLMTGS